MTRDEFHQSLCKIENSLQEIGEEHSIDITIHRIPFAWMPAEYDIKTGETGTIWGEKNVLSDPNDGYSRTRYQITIFAEEKAKIVSPAVVSLPPRE